MPIATLLTNVVCFHPPGEHSPDENEASGTLCVSKATFPLSFFFFFFFFLIFRAKVNKRAASVLWEYYNHACTQSVENKQMDAGIPKPKGNQRLQA
jgi:hypothetical protein